MNKILAVDIEKELVTVALDNGLAKDLPLEVFHFKPEIGEEIEVHKKEDGSFVVSAKDQGVTQKLWFGWVISLVFMPLGLYFFYKAKHMKSFYFVLVLLILTIIGAMIE